MNGRTTLFIGLFLAVVATAIAFWLTKSFREASTHEIVPATGLLTQPIVSTRDFASEGVTRRSTDRDAVPASLNSKGENMAEKLGRALDLRVFAESAKLKVKDGGLFYEQAAVERCREFAQMERDLGLSNVTNPISAENQPKVEAAREVLRRKCMGFITSELDLERFFLASYKQQALAQGDPFINLQSKLLNAISEKDKSAIRSSIEEILRTRDPILIQKLAAVSTKDGYYFDGNYYDGAEGGARYYGAIVLVSCRLGDVCDSADFFVLKNCVTIGICANDRISLMKEMLKVNYNIDKVGFDEVVALSNKMFEAIDSARFDLFYPQNSAQK